jgi:anti-sigma factor RsiW
MDERVEAYVDGDLSGDELDTFTSILTNDSYWQTQVRQAERIREELHELPVQPCPSDVTQAIFEHTTRAEQAHAPLPWWKDLLRQMMQAWRALMTAHRRPVVDYAVGIALVGIAAFFIVNPLDDVTTPTATNVSSTFNTTTPIQAPYSDADVQRAQQRAYRALQYVSTAGQQASTVVQRQMKDAAAPAADTPTASEPTADATEQDRSAARPARDTERSDLTASAP